MTWKDKLEIGLKDDAPFRRDNLPEFQQETPDEPVAEAETAGADGRHDPDEADRSPEEPGARAEANRQAGPHEVDDVNAPLPGARTRQPADAGE